MSNLFSNKNLFVRFRDPIDFVRIGRVGNYFGLEGFVEGRRDGRRVLRDSQFVEPHPFSEARDKRINLYLELPHAPRPGRNEDDQRHSPPDGTNAQNPHLHLNSRPTNEDGR